MQPQPAVTASPSRIEIRPRRMEFHFDGVPRHWCGTPEETLFWNALSVTFPEGETFFVDAVRRFREKVQDGTLRREIAGFAAQEATHSRGHEAYNAWLSSLGYEAEAMDRLLGNFLEVVEAKLPPEFPLSATCALEHMTSILAEVVLVDEGLRARMHPEMFRLWAWHALEENEHKAVAFEVYQEVSGDYAIRAFCMVLATVILGAVHGGFLYSMFKTDGLHRKPSTWFRVAKVMFGRKGYVTRLAPAWSEYFARDFHPWKHDNRALIETWKTQLGAL